MRRRAPTPSLVVALIAVTLLALAALPAPAGAAAAPEEGRALQSSPTSAPTTTTTSGAEAPGADAPWDPLRSDPAANVVAVAVLGLMVLGLARSAWPARGGDAEAAQRGGPGLVVPLLALAGLGVAAYLTSLEVFGTDCGPPGGCAAVSQGEWAKLFGVVPVGLIGVVGYAAVLAAWAAARLGRGRLADRARVAMLGGTAIGVAFAVYLTLVEPLASGVTCIWCLSSGVIATALAWVSIRPGVAAWRRLRRGQSPGA